MSAPSNPAPVNYLHTVLFSFNAGTPQSVRDRLIASIHAQGLLPGVKGMVVAPNLAPHDPVTGWEWVIQLDFADEKSSNAFQSSAAHQAQIAADFAPNRRDFVMLDLKQPFETTIADNRGCTYRRIGMFNLMPDLAAEEQQRIMAGLSVLGTGDLGVGQVLWGGNCYPKNDHIRYDWMMIRDFADEAAYRQFDASPARKEFLQQVFGPAVAGSLVLEIGI